MCISFVQLIWTEGFQEIFALNSVRYWCQIANTAISFLKWFEMSYVCSSYTKNNCHINKIRWKFANMQWNSKQVCNTSCELRTTHIHLCRIEIDDVNELQMCVNQMMFRSFSHVLSQLHFVFKISRKHFRIRSFVECLHIEYFRNQVY